jgi:hypothetical protein
VENFLPASVAWKQLDRAANVCVNIIEAPILSQGTSLIDSKTTQKMVFVQECVICAGGWISVCGLSKLLPIQICQLKCIRMDEPFDIPVLYRGQELLFPARLLVLGYVHKFEVTVEGQQIFFELDNNGEYRALMDLASQQEAKKLDVELFKAIADSIQSILQ